MTASYGHVDDLCATLIAFVGCRGALGEIINTTAEAVTTLHYVETLARIVERQAQIVFVPTELPDDFPRGVYGHLFSRAHHAVLSTEKLHRLLGPVSHVDFAAGHRTTYEWFLAQGWSDLVQPLADPMWFATWNFEAEARAAAMLSAAS